MARTRLIKRSAASSLRKSAYESIKELILSGALRPLERITEEEVAEKMQLSRTPVREAFGLLAAEGLIVVIPKRGSFVSELSVNDILEIYQIRAPLECMAVRSAAENLTDAELVELDNIVKTQVTLGMDKPEESLRLSMSLHEIIIQSTKNKRLEALLKQLQGQVHRVRATWPSTPLRLKEMWNEHAELVEALKKRDADKAEKIMWYHIEKARATTLQHMIPNLSKVSALANNL
jgi:DNA-binding GntR family transcriptional regulator